MLGFFPVLTLVVKRLRHNLGLTVSTLLGMLSVLTLIVCVPVFSYAVSGELLRQQLSDLAATTRRPLFCMHIYYRDFDQSLFNVDVSRAVDEYITRRATDLMGLRVSEAVMEVHTPLLAITPLSVGVYDQPELPLAKVSVVSMEALPAHARVLEGAWPVPDVSASGPMEAAVQDVLAEEMNLNVGDRFLLQDSIEIEIAGIWRANDPRDPIWFDKPGFYFSKAVWVPEATYRARLDTTLDDSVGLVSWYVIMDEWDLDFRRARRYAQGITRLDIDLRNQLSDIRMDYSPSEPLAAYEARAESLTTLLYAVGAPMALLALLFIGLTANIAVQQHVHEIATVRSRGTSRSQVVTMNLMESLILTIVALPLSFVSGWYAAHVMSKTLSFLQFTSRPPFPLSYAGLNLPLLGGVIAVIVGARFLYALGASRHTIVRMKAEQSRQVTKPLWERFYLDFILLLPGTYAYFVLKRSATPEKLIGQFLAQLRLEDVSVQEAYRFLNQAGLPLDKLQPTGDPYRDPLLFVAPALFAMATCMITLRVVPFLARALAALAGRLPGVSLYLSSHQIARRSQDHASALLLIMISLSLAIFAASAANTLDQWLLDSIYYRTGADLAVREFIPDYGTEPGSVPGPRPDLAGGEASGEGATTDEVPAGLTSADLDTADSPWYLDLRQHLELPGVEGATRVGRYRGKFSLGRGEIHCWIMGIDRMEFPQVAFFRDDLSPASLGALMNALGANQMGVLVPRHLTTETGLEVGDILSMVVDTLDGTYARDLRVVGVYEHFPTVYPNARPTLIVNLEYIFGNPDAVTAYDVWLDLTDEADIPVLVDQIRRTMSVEVLIRGNAPEAVKHEQDKAERVGLFGVLNIGFLTAGLMPGIGFVLYSYASLRRRFIQLGILQAIGLLVRQLVGYLVSEQLLLMGIAISGGAAVGLGTSYIFVPFLQTGTTPGGQIPPFQVFIGWAEAGWLSLGFGLILFSTMLGTIAYLVRLKVFEAVKLGETV
jgi:putative ABC transport system permease protein